MTQRNSKSISTLFAVSQIGPYERYLGDILGINTITEREENSPLKVNTKNMYSLLKHSKQDSSSVAPLKLDGRTLSDDCEKSNALNRQFQSVFSAKSQERLSSLAHRKLQELNDQGCNLSFQSSPYSQMPEIQISLKGIEKLLKSLNPHKAAGSDQFKPIVLQTFWFSSLWIHHICSCLVLSKFKSRWTMPQFSNNRFLIITSLSFSNKGQHKR